MMNNKIVGITCSTFDLLHTGHIIMLEECKKHCDYLICALQNDPTIDRKDKNKPIQSLVERYLQLDAVKYVDKIIPYNDEKELEETYARMGDFLKQKCKGYWGYIFTGNLELAKKIGLKPKRRIEFYTGKIDCRLFEYELYAGSREVKAV